MVFGLWCLQPFSHKEHAHNKRRLNDADQLCYAIRGEPGRNESGLTDYAVTDRDSTMLRYYLEASKQRITNAAKYLARSPQSVIGYAERGGDHVLNL